MLSDFFSKLRFGNPWKYKAPLLISWTYAITAVSEVDPLKSILHILLAYITLFGIAALGYFINDWADINSDKKAGKHNKLGEYSLLVKILILLFLLVISFGSWFYLPLDKYSLILIAVEILLFVLYSLPPFRLKERGFLGVICDTAYAYIVPSVLASYTFYLLGNRTFVGYHWFVLFMLPWLMLVGVRGILFHQLKDFENDVLSNTNTFTTRWGKDRIERTIKILLPFEAIFMLLFFSCFIQHFFLLLPGYIFYFVIRYFSVGIKKKIYKDPRQFSYLFYDDFYLDVLPLFVLLHLCLTDWRFSIILITHLILFRNIVKNLLRR